MSFSIWRFEAHSILSVSQNNTRTAAMHEASLHSTLLSAAIDVLNFTHSFTKFLMYRKKMQVGLEAHS